jgi:hypothetical protein
MKWLKNLFACSQKTDKEIAEEYRIAKEANDEMLREKTVPEGFKLAGIKKVIKDGESATTLTISSTTGDIVPGAILSISGTLPGNALSIDIPNPSPPGNFDGFNETVAEMAAEDNPEETRYFLIKGLYQFSDPNLEPLEAVLYDKEGNILSKRSIMDKDLILSFQIKEIPEEGLDLVLKVFLSYQDHQIIQRDFPSDFAQSYAREYDRIGKFPSNPETKRIVLDLATDSDYQEWVEKIKPIERFLEGFYKDMEGVHTDEFGISSINASAGGICSSALPASVAMPAPVSSAVSDTQITQAPGTFLGRLVQRGPKPAA